MTVLQLPTARVFAPALERARYIGIHGGRGSGKSQFFAEKLVERHIYEKYDAVCLREVQKSLDQSVKKLIEEKIQAMNAGLYFDVQDKKIKSHHGGLTIFSGLQNHTADSIKSLQGFDVAWCEEAQSISARSLELLRPTIREANSELWFSWNPRKATDPVDQLLRGDEPPPDAIVIQANWMDNPWFPDVLRAEMEYDRDRDPDKYAHVWLGEYERNSEARVFRNWKVEEFDSPENETYRLGADWGFAVDPSVLVRCRIDGRRLYVDYEAYMVGCEIDMLPDLFDRVPDSRKWFITADSARPETISYMQKHGFPRISPAIKGAKSIEDGIEFLKSFDIIVHPRCQHVIDELTLYSYKQDPLTGQVLPILADKNNHCVVAGTMVATQDGDKAIENVTTDDLVLTREGFKQVLFSGVTDVDRDVVTVSTTAGDIVCTPDHKIFTSNKGFIRADALSYNDEILSIQESLSCQKNLSTTAKHIGATRIAKDDPTVFISSARSLAARFGSIGKFGKMLTALFQQERISITRMATHQITTYQTLSAYPLKNTLMSMNGRKIGTKHSESFWTRFDHLLKHGTQVLKESKSIEKLARRLTRTLFLLKSSAYIAQPSFCQNDLAIQTCSVLPNAKLHGAEIQGLMMSSESARVVAKPLSATNTESSKFVRGRVLTVTAAGKADKVYDLTVEDQHEFFANGILVHNCIDALRYACEGARKAMAAKRPAARASTFQQFDTGMGMLG